MRLQSSRVSFVLETLMATASFIFSSNLTVAATLNTREISRKSKSLSAGEMPSPGDAQSPATATIL